jgi:tetratricopeptide (TPR) repeat protein
MPAVVGLITRGLALLAEDDGALPEASWLLGVALFETGEFARADEVLESGLRSAEKLGDEPYRWRLTLERSDLRFWREPETVDSADLISQAETAVKALERLEDPAGVARAYRLLGDVLNRMGRQEEAVRAFEEGVRNAAIAGDEREISERQGVGVTLGPMPVESCIRLVEGVIASARRPNVETEGQLGLLYAMQGRFDQAKAILQAALSRAQSEGAEWKAASIAVGLATAHLLADELSAAETVLRPATEALERMGEQSLLSSAAADLAEALYRQGKHREAQEATKLSEAASA